MQGSGFSQGRKRPKKAHYIPGYFAIEVLHKEARATGGWGGGPRGKSMGSKMLRLSCPPCPSPPPK